MSNIKKIKRKLKKERKIRLLKKTGEITRKKRMYFMVFAVIFFMAGLSFRIFWIQFKMGDWLKNMAYKQHTLERSFNPKRGTIYDATGKKILAVSSTVESVTVNPVNIKKEDRDKLAKKLSELFELDYESVLKKISKKSSIETIAKKIDKAKSNELRAWLIDNNIKTGVNIDVDTKRYYPYNTLASQIIGFCGSDNQGLMGIEAKYENELKGMAGSIAKMTDARGGNLDDEGENYIDSVDGNDLILTIDATVQGITEKYLKEACIDNVCTDGGNIVIINPQNGDILAMAGYPDYNLNNPYKPTEESLLSNWDDMTKEEKTKIQQSMWRNKAISDSYEPGSTFKLITASAALEEGITQTDRAGEFNCGGGITIAGVRIKCWRYYRPHGAESLREALMNSCNPVFISLGQQIGVKKYYSYLNNFGFLHKTGIDLQGEGGSIFLQEEKVGPVELATISFGQRFEVTPIQMVTAVSAIANGGKYVTPRVVKGIVNSVSGELKEIEPKFQNNVISYETSQNVLSMMQSVVAEGTGKNAQVKGYSIGGKTGTSEDGVNTGKYVTSFVGVAPIASHILGEVLPYLEVQKQENEEDKIEEVEVPDITGLSIKEAEKKLKEIGLELSLDKEGVDKENTTVIEQIPKDGIKVNKGSKIIIK